MATYIVTDPQSGRRLKLTGDSPPTEQELNAIFASQIGINAAPVQPELAQPEPGGQGILRSAADIPINIGKGAVGGVGLIADTLGADNEISKSIYGVESWLDSLLSAQAKNDQQEIARIMQDAQDKGAWEQVKAGLKALSVAPVDLVSNALGYAAPVAISALALPEAAVGTAAVGLGSAMGVGTVKNAIYNSVLEEAKKAGVPEDEAKKAADAAQSYTGDNLDLIMTGGFLGGLASATGLEKTLVSAIGRNVAKKVGKEVTEKTVEETAKGAPRRFVEGAFKEAALEALQGAQEQYARNVAAQRAGYDVPAMRGVAGAGALEGLVGGVTGGGADVFLGKPTVAPGVGKGDLDTGIGDETIDETAEFENLKVDAASLGIPIDPEDNIDTLEQKIQAKELENTVAGEVEQQTATPVEQQTDTITPQVGLNPVEIYNSISPADQAAPGIHFGNKITEVLEVPQTPAAEPTPAATPTPADTTPADTTPADTTATPVEQQTDTITPTAATTQPGIQDLSKEGEDAKAAKAAKIKQLFDDLEIPSEAPMRRRLQFNDIDDAVKQELVKYKRNENVSPKVRANIDRWLENEDAKEFGQETKAATQEREQLEQQRIDAFNKATREGLSEREAARAAARAAEAVGKQGLPETIEAPAVKQKPTVLSKAIQFLKEPFTQESKKTTTQYTEEPAPSDTSYDVDQDDLSPEDMEEVDQDLRPVETERAEDAEDAAELAEEEFELYGSAQDVEYGGPEQRKRKIPENEQDRRDRAINAVSNKLLTAQLELENPKTEAARKKVLPAVVRELEKRLADLKAPTAEEFLAQQPPERLEGEELDAKVMDLADGVTDTLGDRYALAKLDSDTEEITNLTDVVRTHAAEEAKELLTTNNYIPGVTSDAVADRIHSRISNLANLFRYVAKSGNPKEAVEAISNKLLGDKIAKEKEVEIAKTIAENHPDIEILNAPKYVAPPLSDAGVVLVTNGDTGAVIDHIIKTTNDPIVRRVMSAIRGLGLKTRLVVQESTDPEFGGNYDSNADTITIDPTQINEPVLVHELIHAAISHVLSNTKLKFTQDLTKLFNLVKKKLGKRYGTRNIDEFASELISNKAFQEEVKALDRGNIFTRIVRAIAEFFNFSPRTSIFDEAVDTITDIISISNQVFKNGANRGQLNELAQGKKTKEQRKIEDVTAAADRVVRESGLLYTLTHTLSSKDSSELSGMFRTIMNKAQRLKFTQALTTRGLFDVAKKIGVAPLATVEDILLRKIPELRNKIRRIDDRLIDLTLKWGAKNPKNLVRLGEATNAARIYQIDPSKTDVVTAIENDETVQYYDTRAKDPKYRNAKDYNLKRKKARIQQIEYTYKKYESLGGEGRSIYKSLQKAYKKQLEDYEAAIRDVIAEITNTLELSEATDLQEKLSPIFEALFSDVHKVGVYFPLGRHGDYWIRIGKGKNGETQFFDSEFARDRYRRQVERDTPADKLPPIEVGNNPDELKKTLFSEDNKLKTTQILQDVFAKIDGLSGQMNLDTKTGELSISQNALSGLKDEFLDMYLRALPGADLRKRYLRSTQKAGFSSDVLRTFIVSSYKHSNQLPRIKYGMALATQLDSAVDSVEGQPVDSVSAVKDLTQAIKERAQPELAPDSSQTWLDAAAQFANQTTFLYTMTSLKTALVAFTQLPTFGAPVLTAKYGAKDTMAMIAKYTGLLLSTNALSVKNSYTNLKGEVTSEWVLPTIENSAYLKNNPRLAVAYEQGGLWGVFEQGFGSQFKQVAENPTYEQYTPAVRAKKTVYGFLTAAFSTAERVSREIMFMSAYELAYNKAKKEKVGDADANARALLEAEKDTAKSMFDYSRMNKQPILYKNAWARVFFQFMTFPLNAAGFLIRNAATMLSGLQSKDPVAAKQAAIELFGTLGAIYMFAGVTGLPMFSLIMGLLEGLRDQLFDPTKYTDPEDPRSNVPLGLWFTRTYIPSIFGEGSGVVSGPISTMLDVDIGSSVGLNNLFFRDEVLADGAKDWVQQAIFYHLSPPALSVVGQIASGVELMNEGKFLRGAERIVPAFFRGTLVANRLATEGSVTPMGAELIQPEFFTAGKLIAQGVGFKTVTEKEIQNAIFEAKRFDEAKKIERNKLLNELNNAYMELEAAEKQGKSTDAAYAKMNTIIEKMITYSLANPYRPFETEGVNDSLRRRAEARAKATMFGGLTAESDEVLYYLMRMTKLGLNK